MSIWKCCWHCRSRVAVQLSSPAQAQDWPNRPVKIIVPFAPGGNADGMARIIGQRLGEVLGQQFVVENRTGAGGTIAVRPSRVRLPTATRCCGACSRRS